MITVTSGKVFDDSRNAVRAIADVALDVVADGTSGKIVIHGVRVMHSDNGKGPWISFPAKQGQKTWFDIVIVSGALHKRICEALLVWYGQELEEHERSQASRPA